MMTVSKIAKRTGMEPEVVRFYTRIGLLQPIVDAHNKYKTYAEADIVRLRFIHKAQSLGYTLKEIGQILEESSRKQSPCPTVRRIIESRTRENREKLDQLTKLQQRMEHAAAQWAKMPDGVPTGETVCHLIESVSDENTTFET
jgi:DNA-binding transcriptional MerR regulator